VIRGIHLTDSLSDAWCNTGKYEVSVKPLEKAEHIKCVSIYAIARQINAINMLLAWGFANTEEEVNELTETLLAACELHYSVAKGE
jgi:hypothetical protein